MTWVDLVLAGGIAYVAWSHDRHINGLHRKIADLERRLREAYERQS